MLTFSCGCKLFPYLFPGNCILYSLTCFHILLTMTKHLLIFLDFYLHFLNVFVYSYADFNNQHFIDILMIIKTTQTYPYMSVLFKNNKGYYFLLFPGVKSLVDWAWLFLLSSSSSSLFSASSSSHISSLETGFHKIVQTGL